MEEAGSELAKCLLSWWTQTGGAIAEVTRCEWDGAAGECCRLSILRAVAITLPSGIRTLRVRTTYEQSPDGASPHSTAAPAPHSPAMKPSSVVHRISHGISGGRVCSSAVGRISGGGLKQETAECSIGLRQTEGREGSSIGV